MKTILISNDDGYNSDGIRTLAESLSQIAKVIICAPATDQSAVSHAMTLFRPLRMKQHKNAGSKQQIEVYSVDGTPTDSVYLGFHHLLKDKKPDLVACGINHGPNLGQDVLYSGTVSGAMEAAFLNIPAVAFSLVATHGFNFAPGAEFAAGFCKKLLDNPMPAGSLVNVNFPKQITEPEYSVVDIGRHHYSTDVDVRTDPRGNKYFWIGGEWDGFEEIPGTDCVAISEGKITVTPVRVNLTNKSMVKYLEGLK